MVVHGASGMLSITEKWSRTISIIISLAFLFTSIMFFSPDNDINVSALDQVSPIDITGNSELASHPELDSGSGTSSDPYIFSDMSIDCTSSGSTGISVVDTTKYVVFRNITIYAHTSNPAINLDSYHSGSSYYSMYVTLKNITIIGGGKHLEMDVPINVIITDCNFSNPSGTGDIIHSYYGYYVTFDNNIINAPGMNIDLEYTSYTDMRMNDMTFNRFNMDRFRSSMFENNSFELVSMDLFSGYFSVIQMNDFVGRWSSYDLLSLHDCNRIWIANNSFTGGNDAIFIQHPNSYSPYHDRYYSWSSFTIQYNTFEDAYRGIYFYHASGHPSIAFMQVHHNDFISCTTYAILLNSGGSATTKVYRNAFIENNGAGEVYSALNAQCRDAWSQFSWSDGNNGVGNYWSDWERGDDDNDGFIDDGDYPLSSNNGQTDPYPVSNRYFDFTPPLIEITEPSTMNLDNRYLNISWDASDPDTGIMTVQIRKGATKWTNVSGRDHHGLYLSSGLNYLQVRAVNNGGLKTLIDLNYLVEDPNEPVVLVTPKNGEYYSDSNLEVVWTRIDEFVPRDLTTSLNGGPWTEKDPFEEHIIDLEDGTHNYRMNFTDHYGNKILKNMDFTIDTVEPTIEILYPLERSVISNQIVNFLWNAEDNSGISSVSMKIDDGVPFKVEGGQGSYGMDLGPHTVVLTVQDLGGNNASTSVSFSVGKNTSLHITGPLLSKPTRDRTHTITWEYLSIFEIGGLSISIDGSSPLTLPEDSTSYNLNIAEEGSHTVMVRATDPAGNVYSDTIEIYLDLTAPVTGFTSPLDGDYLNRTDVTLRWSSLEEGGMKGYDLILDGKMIVDDSTQTELNIYLEEGAHVFQLKAVDLAGNQATEEMTITIDITRPVVNITSPTGEVTTDSYLDLRWEGNDNIGIERYNYSIDGKPFLELGQQTSRSIQVSEGYHTVILNARDLAGNIRTIRRDFVVDLNPPEVALAGTDQAFIREWKGLISWNVTEEMGISSQILTIDGVEYSLSIDSRYYISELKEGYHEISIKVIDIGGWNSTDEFSFTIDNTEPMIEKGETDIDIDGNKATLYWTLEPGEGPLEMRVIFDGSETQTTYSADSLSLVLAEIGPGEHVVKVQFTDRAGNSKELEYIFTIEEKSSGPASEDGTSWGWLIIVIIAFIMIVGIALFFMIRKRPDKEDKEVDMKKLTGKVDKITIGPMPTSKHQSHGPSRSISGSAPTMQKPAPKPAVESRVGGGYIRPERKRTPRKRKNIRDIKDHDQTSGSKKETPPKPIPSKKEDDEIIEDWGEVEDWDDMEEMEEIEEFEELEEA